MEADLDKGTLRFWVDGKQHGLGHVSGVISNGVKGRLRWALAQCQILVDVEIVPTPELQPWSASWVPRDLQQ
jgi:hypothetical protein